MRLAHLALAAVLLFAAPALAFDARDRTFEAGRVGAIIQGKTKPQDLARIYGEANVEVQETDEPGGGEAHPAAFIFRGTPDALEVHLTEDGTRIVYVSVGGKNWASASGLRLGVGRAVLERLNGGPFRFYGTGFDYGGMLSETGPALKKFTIHVSPIAKARAKEAEHFMGEKTFSSRDPALKEVEVIVIRVNFDPAPQ